MNTIDTAQLLNQLRLAAAQARGTAAPAAAPKADGANFSAMLKQSIDAVNSMQQNSAGMKTSFEMGDPNVSLPDVMIAANKADLAFQATVQVRNRIVEAYQEIMRMQV
jgi:flagellar hook-basal body complex protein FliE